MTEYMNWFFYGRCESKTIGRELFFLFLLLTAYLYLQGDLFMGRVTYNHDGVLWYGMFHYFAESLWSGFFPTWDPYVHGGEPFYYVWGILRLLDPVTLAVIGFGKLFRTPLFDLYHYNFVVRIIVASGGLYLFYRRVFARFFSTYVVMIMSLMLAESTLLTVGTIDSFSWLPWMMYFLIRMMDKDGRWDLLFFSYLAGMVFGASSYHWALPFYFIAIFMITLAVWQKDLLKKIFSQDRTVVMASVLVFSALSAPLLALAPEKPNIVPIAREYNRSVKKASGITGLLGVDYDQMKKRNPEIGLGNYDYLFRFLPYGRHYEFPELSYVARLLFVIGLIFGCHRFKRNFMVMTLLMFVVYIGPFKQIRLLHQILYFSFPPLWLVRHMSLFEPFVYFAAVFFVGIGLDTALSFIWQRVDGADIKKTMLDSGHKTADVMRRPILLSAISFVGAALFLYYVPMKANFFNNFFLTHSFYMWFGGILILWALSIIFFRLFFPHIRFAGPIMVMFTLLILEQHVIINHITTNHFKPDRDLYFSGFSFDGRASTDWRFPDTRVAGLNLKKTYLAYSPVILKVNTAFDDILGSSKSGGPTNIPASFQMNFSQGLYHFWLKPYLQIYEVAEENVPVFKNIAGVDARAASFYTKAVIMPPEEQGEFFKNGAAKTDGRAQTVNNKTATRSGSFKNFKNGSFESWVHEKGAPDVWSYQQSGIGGAAKKNENGNMVKDGRVAVTITPSSKGASMIRQTFTADKMLRGNYVRFFVWVKTPNTRTGAVQVDIQDGFGAPVVASAKIHEGWQVVEAAKRIDKGAKDIYLTINVDSNADAVATFDGAGFEVIDKAEAIKIDLAAGHLNGSAAQRLPAIMDSVVFLTEGLDARFRHLELDKKSFQAASSAAADKSEAGEFTYAVKSYQPTRVAFDVSTVKDGIFYFRDAFDKHWEVYVDGKEENLYKANIAFKAVPLTAGRHEVVFRYNPAVFLTAVRAYFGVHLILASAGVFALSRRVWKKKDGTRDQSDEGI